MNNFSNEDFCKSLPKIELHAHLNGSLSETTLIQLGSTNSDIAEYQKLKHVPPHERTLNDCFKIFQFAHKVTTSPNSVYAATKNVIDEFFLDNVIYLELRTTPRSEDGMDAETYIESVVEAIKDNEKDILVKLILSINRQHSLEVCRQHLDIILKMKKKYPDIIKGIDLSGNPHHGRFSNLQKLFQEARDHGLFTTIHCAEIVNNDEVKDILHFEPDRIGHAPFVHPRYGGCAENWTTLQKNKVPTEFCLTSNIISGTTNLYENHHIREWINNKLPFSINTDDKGIFHTNLSQEFEYALKYLALSPLELWQISLDSVDHTFATSEEKSLLRFKLEQWKKGTFEQRYKENLDL
ncbi:hypothetical protein HHI36_003547 [Cryptolaemus montrouzieri]|uniref:Adenosine deaminase domain-containing protein n=1 Tax=Cryptolaemus montrouzieri TaxID=559131 RepID=A0ABD2PE88_9CUCU